MTALSANLQNNWPAVIVNVASVAAYYVDEPNLIDLNPRRSWSYPETKAAVITLSMEAARRLRGRGIFVNAVHPGDTSITTHDPNASHAMMTQRDAQCCTFNMKLNAIVRRQNLPETHSCCDSSVEAAYSPTWLALNSPKYQLSGTWWAKVYRMPSHFDDLSFARSLWNKCKELSYPANR